MVLYVSRLFTQEDENQAAMQKKKYEKYCQAWIDGPVMHVHASSSIVWATLSSVWMQDFEWLDPCHPQNSVTHRPRPRCRKTKISAAAAGKREQLYSVIRSINSRRTIWNNAVVDL